MSELDDFIHVVEHPLHVGITSPELLLAAIARLAKHVKTLEDRITELEKL